jgi:hypothetical protein
MRGAGPAFRGGPCSPHKNQRMETRAASRWSDCADTGSSNAGPLRRELMADPFLRQGKPFADQASQSSGATQAL